MAFALLSKDNCGLTLEIRRVVASVYAHLPNRPVINARANHSHNNKDVIQSSSLEAHASIWILSSTKCYRY
jgi:hypothetical protein